MSKTHAATLGILIISIVLCTCVYEDPAKAAGNNESNFFFVSVDDKQTRNTYEIVRIALIDAEGTQLADSAGPLDGKYRIVPPVIEDLPMFNYLIELRTLAPQGEKIELLAPNALALGYLKSRYLEIRDQGVPMPGETVTLSLDSAALNVGYCSGGMPVGDIPNLPPFFKIEVEPVIDTNEKPNMAGLLAQDYTPVLAVAIKMDDATGEDPGIKIDTTKSPPIDQASVLAIAAPDTGWFMLMQKKIPEGTKCRYWIFFTKGGDYTTLHLAYHIGEIPSQNDVIKIPVDFAGIPVPNKEALALMALPDSLRAATPYRDLSDSFVLTGGNVGDVYDLSGAQSPWRPIGRDPSYTGLWGDSLPAGNAFSAFTGWFDGAGYTIWNVMLDGTAVTNYNGLFGFTQNALFRNVRIQLLAAQSLTVPDFARTTANGFLAGYAANAMVKHVYVEGNTFNVQSLNNTDPNYAGGVIGMGNGITLDTTVSANFTSITVNGGSPSNAGTVIGKN